VTNQSTTTACNQPYCYTLVKRLRRKPEIFVACQKLDSGDSQRDADSSSTAAGAATSSSRNRGSRRVQGRITLETGVAVFEVARIAHYRHGAISTFPPVILRVHNLSARGVGAGNFTGPAQVEWDREPALTPFGQESFLPRGVRPAGAAGSNGAR
jgi:hypothetical protein